MKGWRRLFRRGAVPAPPALPAPAEPAAPDKEAIKTALQAGLRHHQAGQLAEARRFYTQALALDADQPDALHLLGVAAHQSGDDAQAAELIGRAIAISPGAAAYHSNLGNVFLALGRFEAAIGAFETALRLQPDYAEVYYNLGNAQLALKNFAAALAAYDAALRLRPDYPEALSNRGNALSGLGRVEAAIASFEAAIRLRPGDLLAYHKLGNARMELEQFDAALAAFDAALQVKHDYPEGLTDCGIALLRLGRPGDALIMFEHALRLTPAQAQAHYHRGTALAALGRDEAAIEAFRTVLRLRPDNADARARLEFVLYRREEAQGRYEAALAHLRAGNRLRRAAIAYDEGPALRLMERIRAAFSPELLARAAVPSGPPDVPVFILGMPRSGSTLVEQILASHPEVQGGGERRYLADCAAGGGRGAPYPENIAARSAAELAAAGAAYRARLQALFPGAKRITDKQPANFHHVGLIRLALPGAKIIHTRRNAVDTCFSCFAQMFGEAQPFTNDLDELGRYYRAYAQLMAHWRENLPAGAMLEVDYEELVADFEPQVRRILAFCELDWDPACLAFHETERTVLTASAGQVRQKLYAHAAGRTQVYGAALDGLRGALNGGS